MHITVPYITILSITVPFIIVHKKWVTILVSEDIKEGMEDIKEDIKEVMEEVMGENDNIRYQLWNNYSYENIILLFINA
jgi:hypothetical protein